MEDRFQKAYDLLNAAQKDAVDTIEGPVMVIAGPGTGKTQILTLRIAKILRSTDTAPENILALTYTEAGARAMRERLRTYIGPAAHRVSIYTFHKFAGQLIGAYPDAYERVVGGRPATDLEKVSMIEEILESSQIRLLRPRNNARYYVNPILSTVALMKREYITPDRLAEIIVEQETTLRNTPQLHEKGPHMGKVRGEYQKLEKVCEKNRELLFVYRAYESVLATRRLYDFEDMIYETVRALEGDANMLRDLQERYLYILADEHQDVNGAQNKILDLLASFHDRPNLFVVGDEKQAIYRFQGASLENFLYFEERFAHAKTIALTENYRSTQSILDFAHALITEEESPASALRVELHAATPAKGAIEWREYPHEAIEDEALVARVESLAAHEQKSEIAIIVRSNREVERYAQLLRAAGIPVRATADSDILGHPVTHSVRALITAIVEPTNEEALFTLLHEPYWKIRVDDLVRIFRTRSNEHPLSEIIADAALLETCGVRDIDAVTRVAEVIHTARSQMHLVPPHRLLAQALATSGFVDQCMQFDPLDAGRTVRRLYDEIESLVRSRDSVTLEDVARMFSLRAEYGLPLTAPYIRTHADAVNVMTAHKSKGLEFAHVFLPHLTDDVWGDTTPRRLFTIPISRQVDDSAFDALDDERKLLYVALTRAKTHAYLSCARENVDGRPQIGTPLLDSIFETHVSVVPTEVEIDAFNPLSVLLESAAPVLIDAALLQTNLSERGLSATSLNNYLRSPWNYVYRNVLRIPEVQKENLQFGTALHGVLASATQYRRIHNAMPTGTQIKQFLERELDRLPLGVHEYTRFHERGLEILTSYLAQIEATLPAHTREEMKLQGVLKTGIESFPEVRLTGALDRLDFDGTPQENGQLLHVVDYKSGKPKTKGEIEGTTKDSDGNYKRQLIFYALLLSLQDDERLHTRSFTLSFVEPDAKGKIREESFVITDAEIASLTQDIIRVVEEIIAGAFLTAPCDPEKSDYCSLVAHLRRRT